jgi:hypothetical protein
MEHLQAPVGHGDQSCESMSRCRLFKHNLRPIHSLWNVVSEAWKRIDLGGEGLQQTNLRLTAALRRPRVAYLLWLAFPLGAHRAYLREPRGAWAYRVASLVALACLAIDWRASAMLAGVVLAAALLDLYWIRQRVTALNKELRMQAYLRPVAGAPAGFRGRFTEDGEPPSRAPSFAEQESLLAEIERRKRREN